MRSCDVIIKKFVPYKMLVLMKDVRKRWNMLSVCVIRLKKKFLGCRVLKERATAGPCGPKSHGLHAGYNARDNGLRPREGELIP